MLLGSGGAMLRKFVMSTRQERAEQHFCRACRRVSGRVRQGLQAV